VRGKGSKLGEPCSKVRLSQDRLPIESFAYFAQISFVQMSLCANVTQPCFSPVLKCGARVDVSKSDEHTSAALF
jgi:hypothetical protein